jgi:TolB-like protein/class 3 adenylate cyclase
VGPEQRKLAAILAADVAGYSRLTGADEEGTLARLRALRSDLFDPAVSVHRGRVVKRSGDGAIVEFRSVVDAVRCAIEVQNGMVERNAGLSPERKIEFRMGIHLGDVVEESDGDLMGDGVNIAARLEGIAEPGRICLSEDAYRQVRDRLKEVFVDLGDKELKNIARPVRVYSVKTGSRVLEPAPLATATESSRPPRLSIMVLPFTNLSGDTEQDYFVDAVTEMLTIDLSRIEDAFVISCNTALTYKGKVVDVRQISRELGVRYVMEGSVQSLADRVRVSAQLIDGESGALLWAERFDKARADLFDMQDEITTRLARALGIELVAAEGRRAERERPNNMNAADLAMRGWAIAYQFRSVERRREARALFEAALRLDNGHVPALCGLAQMLLYEVVNDVTDDPAEHIRVADAVSSRALALAPGNARAHISRSMVLSFLCAPEEALRECELAIAQNRNHAWAHAWLGFVMTLLGRAEETEAHVTEALRLSPRDPGLCQWFLYLGTADLHLGKLESAIGRLTTSIIFEPNQGRSRFLLAAALALAGRESEAAQACAEGRRLAPRFGITKFRLEAEARSHNARHLAQCERICEGMRRAHVPE